MQVLEKFSKEQTERLLKELKPEHRDILKHYSPEGVNQALNKHYEDFVIQSITKEKVVMRKRSIEYTIKRNGICEKS